LSAQSHGAQMERQRHWTDAGCEAHRGEGAAGRTNVATVLFDSVK
jgi:hypothetical protein